MELIIIAASVLVSALYIGARAIGRASSGSIKDQSIARVYRVLDGDTVILARGSRRHTVRLDSIDCPENGQHWGNIATAGLIKLIGGKSVKIELHGKDQYQRTLATLFVHDRRSDEWINVNARMVALGHAWVYRVFYDHLPADRKNELNRLERWARSRRVGLWRSSNPTPPWKWRNSLRSKPVFRISRLRKRLEKFTRF